MNKHQDHDQLVRGMLFFAVLALLDSKDSYPAQLLLRLEGTPFETQAGTLYPLMTRMQKQGLVSSRWNMVEGKPPLRMYSITDAGQIRLQELRLVLNEMNKVLGGL
jgi:PadR family transcriptional regulator PadR